MPLRIGSTVDPKNGDMGPRAITVVPTNVGKLKKDQILVFFTRETPFSGMVNILQSAIRR
jgi:hypothetical protein